jgi:putative membrane protein
VRRIIVKQSKTIEGTYYLIRKMLSDPKIARTFFVPIGIILIIYSLFVFANYPQYAVGTIILLVGIYLILRAYDLDTGIETFFYNTKTALLEGRISFVTYIIAAILTIIGFIEGFYTFWRFSNQPVSPGLITLATSFIYGAIWYLIASGIFVAGGKLIDAIIEHKNFIKYISMSFLLISAGLALWGGSLYILSNYEPFQMESSDAIRYFALSIFGSVFIAIVGILPMRGREPKVEELRE